MEKLIELYLANPTLDNVKALAAAHDMTFRSLIGKLNKAGVYQKARYVSKLGEPPITKLELVHQIEAHVGIDLSGLEKAPKLVLVRLAKQLAASAAASLNQEDSTEYSMESVG